MHCVFLVLVHQKPMFVSRTGMTWGSEHVSHVPGFWPHSESPKNDKVTKSSRVLIRCPWKLALVSS